MLGITKVKESCRRVQHYGQMKDETGMMDEPDEAKCLSRIKDTLATVKEESAEAEQILERFFAR